MRQRHKITVYLENDRMKADKKGAKTDYFDRWVEIYFKNLQQSSMQVISPWDKDIKLRFISKTTERKLIKRELKQIILIDELKLQIYLGKTMRQCLPFQ